MSNKQFDPCAIEIIADPKGITINTMRAIILTIDGDYTTVDVNGCTELVYDKEQVIIHGSNDMENWFDLGEDNNATGDIAGIRYIRVKRKATEEGAR